MKKTLLLLLALSVFLLQGCTSDQVDEPVIDVPDTTESDTDTDVVVPEPCTKDELILATTTSTDNTGLLDYLLPVFEEEYCVDVSVVAVGTGAALELGQNGDADALLVHATDLELEFVDHAFGTTRHDVMFNDFVFLGADQIPATTLEEAFAWIYTEGEAGNITFNSRGDNSGTEVKEKSLWAEFGYDTESFGDWYQEVGKGMGDTIVMTDVAGDYTFSDRGTYLAMKEDISIGLSFESPVELKNQYGVIVVNPSLNDGLNNEDAVNFYNWMISEEAQGLIDSFTSYGEKLFYSNASGGIDYTFTPCTEQDELILATTTSTDNTGLLDKLLPYFEARYCVDVSVVAVGTGAALELGQNGDADALLVHATDLELEFVQNGYGVERHDVMYNDFVFLGPDQIPATTLEEAFAWIYTEGEAGNIIFNSRGDNSGTEVKEKSLWVEFGYDTESFGDWYQEVGKGMGDTIVMSDVSGDYTFSDRGTYLAMKEDISIGLSFESPVELKNQYGVIVVNPEIHEGLNNEDAVNFYNWILSDDAQTLIDNFRSYGEVLFFSNAG